MTFISALKIVAVYYIYFKGYIKILNICFHVCFVVNKFMWQYQCHNKNGFYYWLWTTTFIFEIWYRDIGKSSWAVLKDIFLQINPDFFQIFFPKKNFRFFFTRNFFFYFIISFELMITYLSILLSLFKRSPFHTGTFISFVAMIQFEVCLSIWIFV